MVKPNLNNNPERFMPSNGSAIQGKGDRILSLIHTGIQEVNALASTVNTVNSTLDSKKKTDTENTIKLDKAKTDAQKEENRHSEEMAKIDREWAKISNEAADRDKRLSFIQEQIQRLQAEYDKYMAMETEEFLSDTVTTRLEGLRKVILELTKELIRA